MKCKICQSDSIAKKFNLYGPHDIYTCRNCSVEFMSPQLTDAEITELYSENYYQSWGISGSRENESSKNMKIATFLLRLDKIKNYISKGKVLDVGCATGYFLEAAKLRGYTPYGVELSNYSSTIAKEKFGQENIFNGKLEDCTFTSGMFSAVTMFDLIEHVRSPLDTVKAASSLLTSEGIIVITTPDNSSVSNKLMGKKWTHYKREHFYYFNKKSLDYAARECNMKIVYSERSNKALNIDYLHTQLNVYKHWLFTPLINIIYAISPRTLTRKNFSISIGEITVFLKKNS